MSSLLRSSFLSKYQCCQKFLAENPHSIYQKSPLVPTKFSSQKSPHFAKISPLFLKIPTIFEKNPNILLKFLQFFQKIPTFFKNSPHFSKFFKNFNPHLKKMVPTKPLKIPTVGINPHFRQHWLRGTRPTAPDSRGFCLREKRSLS